MTFYYSYPTNRNNRKNERKANDNNQFGIYKNIGKDDVNQKHNNTTIV